MKTIIHSAHRACSWYLCETATFKPRLPCHVLTTHIVVYLKYHLLWFVCRRVSHKHKDTLWKRNDPQIAIFTSPPLGSVVETAKARLTDWGWIQCKGTAYVSESWRLIVGGKNRLKNWQAGPLDSLEDNIWSLAQRWWWQSGCFKDGQKTSSRRIGEPVQEECCNHHFHLL